MQMNPYQISQTNSYVPQYQSYQQAYNPMQNIQRFQQDRKSTRLNSSH